MQVISEDAFLIERVQWGIFKAILFFPITDE